MDEKGLDTKIVGCDCEGECGYGPNVVINNKIVNGVRGRQAIAQALGVEEIMEVTSE